MKCPLSPIHADVGEVCQHKHCWQWHKNVKGNCVVTDVGTSHLMKVDVARIYGESVDAITARIERGRAKLSAWLALLGVLEEHRIAGCPRCGAPKCRDGQCDTRVAKIAELKSRLPFEEFIEMTPSKWYAVLHAKASGNPAFSIKIQPNKGN